MGTIPVGIIIPCYGYTHIYSLSFLLWSLFHVSPAQVSFSEFVEVVAACAVHACADPFIPIAQRIDAFVAAMGGVAAGGGAGLSAAVGVIGAAAGVDGARR